MSQKPATREEVLAHFKSIAGQKNVKVEMESVSKSITPKTKPVKASANSLDKRPDGQSATSCKHEAINLVGLRDDHNDGNNGGNIAIAYAQQPPGSLVNRLELYLAQHATMDTLNHCQDDSVNNNITTCIV